jgi:D-alanyl-D-alanine carboxypeptidase
LILAAAASAAISVAATRAGAEALLLVDIGNGKVLHARNATVPWYPASVTKIMTTYVTLRAIREGRLTLDTLLTVSPNAVAQEPVKMGFPAGTKVTVDNALKMLLVKSANDMAVVLAEGVGGSIEGFADLMNENAKRLGMTQSNFVNPNGLPADQQITSARDLAILVRAVRREFPEYDYLWHLPGIRFGKRVVRNYNTLLGRYPGADGMKTGFICASGFNLVATATRNGKSLVAIVLGAPSSATRAIKAAQLLEEGFSSNPLSWLVPSFGTVDQLVPASREPPNLHDEMCGPHRKRPAAEDEDDTVSPSVASSSAYAVFLSNLRVPASKAASLLQESNLGEPVVVYTGPTRKPGEIVSESKRASTGPKAKPKPKSKTAAPKSKTAAKTDTPKPQPRKTAAKPAPKKQKTSQKTPQQKSQQKPTQTQ